MWKKKRSALIKNSAESFLETRLKHMRYKASASLTLLSAIFSVGCTISIPTGTSEEKYLDAKPYSLIASSIEGVEFNSEQRVVLLNIKQYRLSQLHEIPRYLEHSNSGMNFNLNYSEASPRPEYRWDVIDSNYSSVHEAISKVSVIPPVGTPMEAEVGFYDGKIELELNDMLPLLRAGVLYSIECARCYPDFSHLTSDKEDIPAVPVSADIKAHLFDGVSA